MDRKNTDNDLVVKFKKIRLSPGFFAMIFFIIIFIIVIIVDGIVWWAVVGLLVWIPSLIFAYTNLFKSFRSNDCPIEPLIINKQGILVVDEENNILIKWEEIAEIWCEKYHGEVVGIFKYRKYESGPYMSGDQQYPDAFGRYKHIIIYLLPTEEEPEGFSISIDVTYADHNVKEIIRVMQSYLQKYNGHKIRQWQWEQERNISHEDHY